MTPREAFELLESGESPEEVARRLERSWWFPLEAVFVVGFLALLFVLALEIGHLVGE